MTAGTIVTILTGFFAPLAGLVGALIGASAVLKGQRETRKHDIEAAEAALMRDKAAEIFTEISRLERMAVPWMVDALKRAADVGDGGEPPQSPNLGDLRALLGVYFPHIAPIVDEIDQSTKAAIMSVKGDDKLNTKKLQAATAGAAVLKATAMIAQLPKIRVMVTEAVAPYVPQRPSAAVAKNVEPSTAPISKAPPPAIEHEHL